MGTLKQGIKTISTAYIGLPIHADNFSYAASYRGFWTDLVRVTRSRTLETPVVRFQDVPWKPWHLYSQSSRVQYYA